MKKLQRNFTTPEQSKRLLELGVPKWTADFKHPSIPRSKGKQVLSTNIVVSCQEIYEDEIPLWSTGRLIEILNICSIWGNVSIHRTDREVTQIEQLIEILQNRINGKTIDISKLDE